ncbi:MAG TPA: YbaK/EbsC family protein [Frateuria sp.]|uniref:aminoacyl-tRNA deacylase n=1 Tax=Frateuria sp. TaxID=2211372 RepID=UPI002D7F0D1F|nr:YbaK/EbsC family protein [Frateuria sp.]HET6805631.1 YbaK/EbsC family protein [Frateuria sp.]
MGHEPSSRMLDCHMPALWPLEPTALAEANHPALDEIAAWAKNYLCCPHADLGRNGPMCPFVPGALQKKLLFGTVYEQDDLDVAAIKAILLEEMERFIALEPVSGNEAQFKSLMALFPNLPADQVGLVETAQAELQRHFVPNGLMVGEFHAGPPDKRGLWNPDFRPLYSPVPMLVIRHMVPTDVLFLKDSPDLFREYVKIYGNAVPERFRAQFDEAARRFGLATGDGSTQARGAPRIMEALDAAALGYRVHCHDDFTRSIRSPQDFAQALGYELRRITKTLFVKCRDAERYYLLVCGMDKRIDLQGLAGRLGATRLELASLPDLQRHVGYPPTSVTPIAVGGIPVLMDESLLACETVLTGSGVPRVEIEIAPADLQALCGAQTMALA